MEVMTTTREELKDIFSTNLSDLVKDKEVKDHVVDVLDDFVYERSLPIKEEIPDSVKIAKHFENGECHELVRLGDTYMFMCGFFPEYLSENKKSSMGIKFYVEKGKDSYNYALSLSYYVKDKESSGLISKLSDTFVSNANALLQLRRKMKGGEVVIDPEVYNELRTVLGYKPDPANFFVIVRGGAENPREKYVVNNGNLRRIK